MIKRISLIRRKPGMTPEEFWEHYTGPHAAIAQKMPGVCKMALSRVVGSQPVEWDAVGELWFDDAAAVEKAFADPEIAGLLAGSAIPPRSPSEVIIAEETVFWSAETSEE